MSDTLKSEPVRAFVGVISALIVLLAALGVTDGTAVEVLGQIVILLGGGEAVRRRVSPAE